MIETKGSTIISTRQVRIAELAKRFGTLTTLSHHIDEVWLAEAYRRTRKDGAAGVDGQSAKQYAQQLEENLKLLLERAKAGTYRAPAVRRVHIPKGGGETRPIGIPTFEDKVLQRAVTMVLEAVYEQDFLPCSYGFRPGRNQHQCMDDLRNAGRSMPGGGWVLEMDIRKFFDTIPRQRLLEILRQRVKDGVILRLVAKWLHAGVTEEGLTTYPEAGTPQGGVISPLLANIFLHEVLDTWFERDVRPRLHGQSHLFRYADDAVMLFQNEEDAKRVLEVLLKRFEKFGLALHPEKTRLVRFRRPDRDATVKKDGGGPGTFTFLGFTHHWARSVHDYWVVLRRTASSSKRRALLAVWQWLKTNRHRPVGEQQQGLNLKLRGHYGYFAIHGNMNGVWSFHEAVKKAWKHSLSRRNSRGMTWIRFKRLLARYLLAKPVLSKRAV
jgi:group II intron reverse transcriptase/maturase